MTPRAMSVSAQILGGLKGMTRDLPEGPWDPTKIPRIQNSLSEVASLLSVGCVAFPQLED